MPLASDRREFRVKITLLDKNKKWRKSHKYYFGLLMYGPAVIVILLMLGVSI